MSTTKRKQKQQDKKLKIKNKVQKFNAYDEEGTDILV